VDSVRLAAHEPWTGLPSLGRSGGAERAGARCSTKRQPWTGCQRVRPRPVGHAPACRRAWSP